MAKAAKGLGVQNVFLHPVEMVDHRHAAPAYPKGRVHIALAPIHDAAQFLPIGDFLKRQMFDRGTGDDQPIEFFAPDIADGAVKALHMIGRGVAGAVV